VLVLVLVL